MGHGKDAGIEKPWPKPGAFCEECVQVGFLNMAWCHPAPLHQHGVVPFPQEEPSWCGFLHKHRQKQGALCTEMDGGTSALASAEYKRWVVPCSSDTWTLFVELNAVLCYPLESIYLFFPSLPSSFWGLLNFKPSLLVFHDCGRCSFTP